jgi:hypothetical protein
MPLKATNIKAWGGAQGGTPGKPRQSTTVAESDEQLLRPSEKATSLRLASSFATLRLCGKIADSHESTIDKPGGFPQSRKAAKEEAETGTPNGARERRTKRPSRGQSVSLLVP